jgi:competence protein ComEA
MGLFMRSAMGLRSSLLWVLSGCAIAQVQMVDAPGKEQTMKVCAGCHEVERSISLKQDREGWQNTISKMVGLGAQGSEQEFSAVLDYLSKNYAAEEIAKLNVNKAEAIEFESRLSLTRSQAAAIVAYRAKNGSFKSIEDLKKVPGVDAAKIDAKKDRITF